MSGHHNFGYGALGFLRVSDISSTMCSTIDRALGSRIAFNRTRASRVSTGTSHLPSRITHQTYHALTTTTCIAHVHVHLIYLHLPSSAFTHHECSGTPNVSRINHPHQTYHALNTTTPQRILHISSAFTHHVCPRTSHLPSLITYVHAYLICLQTYHARLPASRITCLHTTYLPLRITQVHTHQTHHGINTTNHIAHHVHLICLH